MTEEENKKPEDEQGPESEEDPRLRFRRLIDDEEEEQKGEESSESARHRPEKQLGTTQDYFASEPDEIWEEEPPKVPPPSGATHAHLMGQPPIQDEPSTSPTDETGANDTNKLADTQPNKTVDEGTPDSAATLPPDVNEIPAPPPELGQTPPSRSLSIDEHGMPLPQRVTETDTGATQVTQSAYQTPVNSEPLRRPGSGPTPVQTGALPPNPSGPNLVKPSIAERSSRWLRGLGCLAQLFVLSLFGVVLLGLGTLSFGVYQYYSVAATLPAVDDLRNKASQFETTTILDRDGNTLYEILDPNAGRRTYVPVDEISPFMIAAIISTEDADFYSNPGFSIRAIFRAFFQNAESGEIVSGASTITQQLARNIVFDPEEAYQLTYIRKVREALLAQEITRRYTKDEILELYLNEIYFGNLAYGIEAASQTYFKTNASKLTLEQASLLAGLPQAPSVYDVYTNREVTLLRQQDVLRLMLEASQEQGCIFVGEGRQDVCLDIETASVAAFALEEYEFADPDIQIQYPHWVNYVRTLLEAQFDPQTIYRSGFTVHTTLNPGLQIVAQAVVQKQIAALVGRNVQSGALVAIEPSTGEILAMVGSADYYNEDIDGQINMALIPRQPGSSIKPLTYTLAFENGWTPGTLIWDVESEFPPSGDPNDPREPFIPVNYDERYHGPVTVRTALSNSYNIPAVKALQFVGIYDDEDTPEEEGMVAFAHRMGISDLNEDFYGLSLTLGGGEVKLLDMASVFGVFANSGQRVPPVAITKIVDHEGNVVFEHETPQSEQVIRAEHAFLINSILSDNAARTPAFGPNSILNLPFTAAVKTGTTNDFRDNWTIGYTPDIAVGVWVGNPDFTQMEGTSGVTGAAPIWAEFMPLALQEINNGVPSPFVRPNGVQETVICAISGSKPSEWCSTQRSEFFVSDQPPLSEDDDLWQEILVDTWTGLRVSSQCEEFTEEQFAIGLIDEWGIKWIEETSQGNDWAKDQGFDDPFVYVPERGCTANDPRPILSITGPDDFSVISSSPLEIRGQADATQGFYQWRLEYGEGGNPDDWKTLDTSENPVSSIADIYNWDISDLPNGEYTIRLRIRDEANERYAEKEIVIDIQLPTPTPTPTPLPSVTPTITETPTVTSTLEPSATVTSTNTIAPTATETETPTATPTP